MIFTAVDLGFMFHWMPMPAEQLVIAPEISWIGAIVLMFAAIVPTTPAKSVIAGLIAVSMNPLSMLIARARGAWQFESATDVVLMHYPDYLLVGVAVVISRVVTSLGQQVAKAREMGSYELGELIGRGGMGEVYKATHRMLARPAAIKLIRPEMVAAGDPEGAQLAVLRFRREAEAAANLRSPHTVELYDFGETDDGTLYFVMELLDGLDLETLVRASRAAAGEPRCPRPASRPASRSKRRTRAASCIATSSPQTFTSDGSGSSATSSRCSTSASSSRRRTRASSIRRRRRPAWSWARPDTWRPRWQSAPTSMAVRTSTRLDASPTISSPANRSSSGRRRCR